MGNKNKLLERITISTQLSNPLLCLHLPIDAGRTSVSLELNPVFNNI